MIHEPLIDDTMVVRHVNAHRADVVFIRGVFEASDGVAAVFSERGGDLWIAAPPSRAAELGQLLADLGEEVWLEEAEASDARGQAFDRQNE